MSVKCFGFIKEERGVLWSWGLIINQTFLWSVSLSWVCCLLLLRCQDWHTASNWIASPPSPGTVSHCREIQLSACLQWVAVVCLSEPSVNLGCLGWLLALLAFCLALHFWLLATFFYPGGRTGDEWTFVGLAPVTEENWFWSKTEKPFQSKLHFMTVVLFSF